MNVKLCKANLSTVFAQSDVLRLGEGGDLTTNVHTKHTLQIYEKLSYEPRNRHFCQTAVIGRSSFSRCFVCLIVVENFVLIFLCQFGIPSYFCQNMTSRKFAK